MKEQLILYGTGGEISSPTLNEFHALFRSTGIDFVTSKQSTSSVMLETFKQQSEKEEGVFLDNIEK